MAWYSSKPLEVYYQIRTDPRKAGKWYKSTGRGDDRYVNHSGLYIYHFLRTTEDPVEFIFNGNSRRPYCGYRGDFKNTPKWNSPLDVFTDMLGMKRREMYLDNATPVKITEDHRPYPFLATKRSNKMAVQLALQTVNMTAAHAKNRKLNLGYRGWGRVQRRLNELGFDAGKPDGILGKKTITAIAMWQTGNGTQKFYANGILDQRQLQLLLK